MAQWDSWDSLVARSPVPRYDGPLRQVRHLLGRRVVDAYGVQVLTDEHLDRARDLSDWLVEPLGHGRNLVRARDLDTWLGPDGPGPQTLERARQDFGDLVLSPAVVAAEAPPPW